MNIYYGGEIKVLEQKTAANKLLGTKMPGTCVDQDSRRTEMPGICVDQDSRHFIV